ncbi:MAG TPA: condensation domain-containing protein, partial [Longimicrobium sp.]|nr:condensation domain-containing protein [Longimicrobium sp.]
MESIVGFHLSPRQRHLWALLQDPGHRARDARALLRLAGPLDADPLAAALEALVARHEILRTSFERLPGMPEALQVVEERGVRWEDAEDLRGLSADAAEGRVEARWSEEPGDGDLPAARLLRTGDDEHRLLLRVHPLSVDEASWELLTADLAALYAAERGGAPVEDEPVPYLAVSEWLNEVNASDDAQAGRAFWLAQCRGPGEALPVEPDGVSGEPAAARRVLPPSLASAVDALAASAGTAPDTVVLAAWTALLHRLGDTGAQRVGVAANGRADEELMTAIGPFTQHLPITATVDAATSFRALVEQLRDARDEAAGMQETFDAEAVHRLLAAEGGAHDATLRFPLGFTPRPAGDTHGADGVSFSVARRRVAGEPFDLHLVMEGGANDVALELRGVGFSVDRVARLLDRVEALLADAVGRPDAPLAILAVMSAGERKTVLRAWNATDRVLPFIPVHEGVAAQAARTPDAVAVAFGGETVTYAELDRRANRLARHLRRLGVEADTRVGVCLERSADLVV